MAYNTTDNGLDLNFDVDPEERKRRLAMMAGLAGGAPITDVAAQQLDQRFAPIQQMIESPEEAARKRLGMQSTVAQPIQPIETIAPTMPVQPQMPDQTDAETQRLLQQSQIAQGTPVQQPIQPVQPEVVQQQTQPATVLSPEAEKQIQQQATETTPARAINPEEVVQEVNQTVLPKAGLGVQVAGGNVAPPPVSTGTGLKAPPGYTQSPDQPYVDQFNKGDLYSLVNPNAKAPDYIRTAAQDQLMENFRQQKIKNAVEEKVNNASNNPQDIMKVFDEFKRSKSEDGSYLRAYMLNRFGFTEAANDEMSKLGWGSKYEHTMLANGDNAMVKYSTKGEPIAGIDSKGNKLTPQQLIEVGSLKGAVTGQTMGFDNKGHVISHTTIPGGKAVIWKDETDQKVLSGAPEGYHTGKNQQEAMAIQAYQRSRQNDEAKNRANVAKGLAPIYTPDQMEERAQAEKSRIMGIATTTYGTPPGATDNVPQAGAGNVPTVGQSAADWAKQNNIPVSNAGGVRTSQEQANQLAQWYSGGMKGPRPAEPGTSKHETGNAIDVPTEGRTPENLAKLKAAGFVNNVKGEPWHFEKVSATPQVGAGAPTLSEVQKNNAKAIANYEAPPLTGTGNNAQNAIIMSQVRELNPQYDGAKYKIMAKTRQDFITGKQGQSVQSMNVAVDHLDTLQEAANALQNGNLPLFNQIGNMYSKNTGSPAVTDFNALKSIVGSEVAKAVAGGATALGDREEIRREINAANSPQQLHGVIEKYQKLMAGQVKGLKQTYESTGLKDFDEKLLPRTKKVLNSVEEPTRSKW